MAKKKTVEKVSRCVLIGVDGSLQALAALEYTVRMTKLIPDLEFVLLEVLPAVPPYLAQGARTDRDLQTRLRKLTETNKARARERLETARDFLVREKIAPDRIEVKTRPRRAGLAKGIITEAEHGLYDTLVVGRRGLTRTEQLFLGSVSNQLVQHTVKVPLWIVDGKVTDPKVMVAVDGSEPSLRAVDHVAFMLGPNPEAEIVFLHVTPRLQSYCAINLEEPETGWDEAGKDMEMMEEAFRREDHVCLDDFLERAIKILVEAGFSRNRIKIEERPVTVGVARTIINAAREGGYGTVVLGRRGMDRSSFLGRISDQVIRRLEGSALWLVN